MVRDEYGLPVGAGFPEIDRKGMVEVDLLMVHAYAITLARMMENAGRALAELSRRRYLAPGDGAVLAGRHVVVLAGAGGNGGGAMTAARRLAAWGARISLVLSGPAAAVTGVPGEQLAILGHMGITPGDPPAAAADLVLDGLIGYSLRGAPQGRAADLIGWANAQTAPVLSLDVPSGFDAGTGRMADPAIRADATLTLALPKRGMTGPGAAGWTGALYLADISVPPALYARLSVPLTVPPFALGDIVRLRTADQIGSAGSSKPKT